MKISKKYIAVCALTAVVGFTSCDDYLDKLPDNRMELKDGDDVSDLLVSAYPTHHPAYLLEMYSDNADNYDVTGWTAYDQFQREAFEWRDITDVSEDESPQMLWQNYYAAIASANQALQFIEQQGNSPEYNAQRGEALMCRAYSEFMLANIFCNAYNESTAANELGVPYPTEPETHVGTVYDRGTLKDTYDKINADIEEALPLVQDQYKQPKYHFTKNASYAFASEFNLYYGNYAKAIQYADRVLGSNPAGVLRDWNAFYSLSANDQVAPNAYINSSEGANLLLITFYSNWGAISYGGYQLGLKYAHGQLLSRNEDLQSQAAWGNNANMGYQVWSNSAVSTYFINKLPYAFEITDQQAQIGFPHSTIPVFTTDGTLLFRAEAKALNGDINGAVEDLSTELSAISAGRFSVTLQQLVNFYNRTATYTPQNPTPYKKLNPVFGSLNDQQTAVIDAILQLRRIMTLGEGQRMQDVKRYGIVIYRRTLNRGNNVTSVTDSLTVDDPRRAIQLPQDVISSGMTANPRNK